MTFTATDAHSSLDEDRAIASILYGAERAPGLIDSWLDEQVTRVHDPKFARRFASLPRLPGIVERNYLHRVVEHEGVRLLGGIRFHGGNVDRAFVEVIAWQIDGGAADPWSRESLVRVTHAVAHEWAAFHPRALRVRTRPDRVLGLDVEPDVDLHGATYASMLRHPVKRASARANELSLMPVTDIDAAHGLVAKRYATVESEDPVLHGNISPADESDMADWQRDGSLHAIIRAGRPVGVIAAGPGRIDWLVGDEMLEEAVERDAAGHGSAALAQRALAERASASARADVMLLGTIDARNTASRRTALAAGRPVVMRYVFVPLRVT